MSNKLKIKKAFTLIELIISIGIILILGALIFYAYNKVIEAKETNEMRDTIIQIGEGMKSNLKPAEMVMLGMISRAEQLEDINDHNANVTFKGHGSTPYLFWVGGSGDSIDYHLIIEDPNLTPARCVAMYNVANQYFEHIEVEMATLKSMNPDIKESGDNSPANIVKVCAEEINNFNKDNSESISQGDGSLGSPRISLWHINKDRSYFYN